MKTKAIKVYINTLRFLNVNYPKLRGETYADYFRRFSLNFCKIYDCLISEHKKIIAREVE